MAWNPDQYLAFADHRLRPAVDLLSRIGADRPAVVFDLGCGAGNVTRLLRARWSGARVVGVDSSAEMLARAAAVPDVEWVRADLAGWRPDRAPDVLFSNAALHWLDGHEALFPRLLGALAPGGTLAVQMPRNHGAPSHTALAELARAPRFRDRLAGLVREAPVHPPAFYWDLLAGRGVALDVWETEYLHALRGEAPVVQWMMGTSLRPLLDALPEPDRGAFRAEYARLAAAAYPPRRDGTTLFPFRRLFLVATKATA